MDEFLPIDVLLMSGAVHIGELSELTSGFNVTRSFLVVEIFVDVGDLLRVLFKSG